MKILIAPNAFKGTYSSLAAAQAIARGLRRAQRSLRLDLMPLADGGPGTLACMKGRLRQAWVEDALGRRRLAKWLALPGKKALIESAQAIGLEWIPEKKRDAIKADSFGLGQLMLAAKKAGCRELLIGLGGSATSDGGLGLARALGWSQDSHGALLAPKRDPLKGLKLRVLCDVDNPLLGKNGAAKIYAPQKGASPGQVGQLEKRLKKLAAHFPKALALRPGAGAAGGLGFGLMAFCKAKLVPGAGLLLKMNHFERRLKSCDLVISGEGRFDAQSLHGKLPAEIARAAKRAGKPCTLLVGQVQGAFPGYQILSLDGKRSLERLAFKFMNSLLHRHLA